MVVIKTNGLLYDETNPRCVCKIEHTQGRQFAFIQCLDVGRGGGEPPETAPTKFYWGEFDSSNPEKSILEILHYGGKFPDLTWSDLYKNLCNGC